MKKEDAVEYPQNAQKTNNQSLSSTSFTTKKSSVNKRNHSICKTECQLTADNRTRDLKGRFIKKQTQQFKSLKCDPNYKEIFAIENIQQVQNALNSPNASDDFRCFEKVNIFRVIKINEQQIIYNMQGIRTTKETKRLEKVNNTDEYNQICEKRKISNYLSKFQLENQEFTNSVTKINYQMIKPDQQAQQKTPGLANDAQDKVQDHAGQEEQHNLEADESLDLDCPKVEHQDIVMSQNDENDSKKYDNEQDHDSNMRNEIEDSQCQQTGPIIKESLSPVKIYDKATLNGIVIQSQQHIAESNVVIRLEQDHFTLGDQATQNGQIFEASQNLNILTSFDKSSIANIEVEPLEENNQDPGTPNQLMEPVDSQNPLVESVRSIQDQKEALHVSSPFKSDQSKTTQRCNMRTRFNGTKVPNQMPKESLSPTPIRSSRRFQIKEQEALNKQNMSISAKDNNQNESINQINSSRRSYRQQLTTADTSRAPREQKLGKNTSQISKNDQLSKLKKSSENIFQEYLKSYHNMFQFDWDLKDFVSSRHSPKDELTPGAFWFYINTTFFPYDLQFKVTDQSFDQWVQPILEQINTFGFGNIQQISTDNNHIIKSDQNKNSIKPNYKIRYQNQLLNQSEQFQNQLIGSQLIQNDSQQILLSEDQIPQDEIVLTHISKLIGKRKKFNRFKAHFNHLRDRAQTVVFEDDEMKEITESAQQIPRKSILETDNISCSQLEIEEIGEKDVKIDEEIAEIKQSIDLQNFQKMISLAEKDLLQIQDQNFSSLKDMFESVQNKYQNALEVPEDHENYRDKTLYRPEEIWKYDQSFLSYVDPAFTQDMVNNFEWYRNNLSLFLLNINYPCKLQTDFLQELELSQQRRNQMRYRKIMDQMDKLEQAANNGQFVDEAKRKVLEDDIKNMSLLQRAQIAQDDACCAICGSGDYEDHDQIVFCVHCSMPVHQSCFGIEKLTEYDWMCYNCLTFGFKKGQMVKCFLCPKKGGSMKPTNIFCSYQKFYEHKVLGQQKKTGKSQQERVQEMAKKNQELHEQELEALKTAETGSIQGFGSQGNNCIQAFKQQILQRLENNTSLNELVQREENYKNKIYDIYYKEYEEWEKAQKRGEDVDPQFNPISKILKDQDDFEFNFNKHEKSNHCIPEDYSRFLSRNQEKLEDKNTPQTETLYHWVHHSCSMWMPGPQVTPRTPVKMNKLDFSKFNIGCVICGKKGPQQGAVIKCTKLDCQIYFHVECAKRANYCMEIEKKNGINNNREKIFKIFCESHRPFKIIAEINEQNAQEVEDIQKFTKTIDKCMEIHLRHQQKPKKLISKTERNKLLRQALQNRKHEIIQQRRENKLLSKPKKEKKDKNSKLKKWKEKDKKILLDRVKEKYLTIKKMRMNLIRVDPMIAENKRYEKQIKKYQKQQQKKLKNDFQKTRQQFLNQLLQERDAKTQERGLRKRNKSSDLLALPDESASAQNLLQANENPLDDPNIYDENKENDAMADGQQQNHSCPPAIDNFKKLDDEDMLNNLENLEKENSMLDEIMNGQMDQDHKDMNIHEQNLQDLYENKITLDFQLEEDEVLNGITQNNDEIDDFNMPEMPELKVIPEFYKFSNPLNVYELEWKVTLSRYDFPWREISFEPFSAKECYKMYTSMVTDPESFLKRVLGQKPKYQKMIQNQLQGLPTIDYLNNMQNPKMKLDIIYQDKQKTNQGMPPIHQMFSISHEPQHGNHLNKEIANPLGQHGQISSSLVSLGQIPGFTPHPVVTLANGSLLNTSLYCMCKGQIISDFMVACEKGEDECQNGGWVHPQCTNDLCNFTREQIDNIDIWYCQDCIAKDNEQKQPSLKIILDATQSQPNETILKEQPIFEVTTKSKEKIEDDKQSSIINRIEEINMNNTFQNLMPSKTSTPIKSNQKGPQNTINKSCLSKGHESKESTGRKESLIVSIDRGIIQDPVKPLQTQDEIDIQQLSVVANIIQAEQDRQRSYQNSARQDKEEPQVVQELDKKEDNSIFRHNKLDKSIQQQLQIILNDQEQEPSHQEAKPKDEEQVDQNDNDSKQIESNLVQNQNFLEFLANIVQQQQQEQTQVLDQPPSQVKKTQQKPPQQQIQQPVPQQVQVDHQHRQPQASQFENQQMSQQLPNQHSQNEQIVQAQQMQQKCQMDAASALSNVLTQLINPGFEQQQVQKQTQQEQAVQQNQQQSQNDFMQQLQSLLFAGEQVQETVPQPQVQQQLEPSQHQTFAHQQLMNLAGVQENIQRIENQRQNQVIQPNPSTQAQRREPANQVMDQQQFSNDETELLLNLLNAAQADQINMPAPSQQHQQMPPVGIGAQEQNQHSSQQQQGRNNVRQSEEQNGDNIELDHLNLTDEQIQLILSQLTQNN